MTTTRILWGRIVVSAVLTEAIMIAIAIPLRLRFGQTPVTYEAVIGSFLLPFLFAVWVGRRASSRRVLHGLMIGVIATAIFLALSEASRRWGPPADPQPFAYTIAHGLKLLGGALGGLVAERQQRKSAHGVGAAAVTARRDS